jgi:hypothetical protein
LASGESADLFVGLNTASAGIYSGSATISTLSHNDDMADLALSDISVDLMAQVNNYANPVFDLMSGDGFLSGSGFNYLLDLGTVIQGTGTLEASLALFNDVLGPADLLDGSFELLATNFLLNGFDPFNDLGAGESLFDLSIVLDATELGRYTGAISLNALGHNESGFAQMFDPITLRITADVAPIPEPGTISLLALGVFALLGFNIRQRRKK